MEFDKLEHVTRWEMVRTIARGGMGTVYEARQLGVDGFEKRVAIKVINEAAAADERMQQQLIDEARLVADLVHENIVQIYQLLMSHDLPVIVMELCSGGTLRQVLTHHHQVGVPFPVDLAAFIASRICRALEYAHTRTDAAGKPLGIVHRDICPNNILITLGGVAKLGDFGVAKATFIPDQEGKILQGKDRYMSPEQASFAATDARSDVFSLGIVLYEMLTATSEDPRANVALDRPLEDLPRLRELRDDVPADLADIVAKSIQRNPARRFTDAHQMGAALEQHLYSGGFGPTNDKLKIYLQQIYPARYPPAVGPSPLGLSQPMAPVPFAEDTTRTKVRHAYRTMLRRSDD